MIEPSSNKEKKMARLIAYPLLAVVIAVFACLAGASSAGEKPVVRRPGEFAGKVVTVYLNGPEEQMGQVLKDVELLEIGGRQMLVGIGADTNQKGDWTAGLRVGVAWDMVVMYYVMTPEQFEKHVKERR